MGQPADRKPSRSPVIPDSEEPIRASRLSVSVGAVSSGSPLAATRNQQQPTQPPTRSTEELLLAERFGLAQAPVTGPQAHSVSAKSQGSAHAHPGASQAQQVSPISSQPYQPTSGTQAGYWPTQPQPYTPQQPQQLHPHAGTAFPQGVPSLQGMPRHTLVLYHSPLLHPSYTCAFHRVLPRFLAVLVFPFLARRVFSCWMKVARLCKWPPRSLPANSLPRNPSLSLLPLHLLLCL